MTTPSASTSGGTLTVVLVHGGFVDGSGWQGVYRLLKDDYRVRIVQNPTISLEGDVAATKLVIGAQSDPVILVGHSYGGAVVTEAGNDPKVARLVYIAAFVPDQGESVETLIADPPAQRSMSAWAGSTVVEAAGSHAIYVSQPVAVADLIRSAVRANANV
jgi:pimeloyl-ACP methyl ester carboxylesterase